MDPTLLAEALLCISYWVRQTRLSTTTLTCQKVFLNASRASGGASTFNRTVYVMQVCDQGHSGSLHLLSHCTGFQLYAVWSSWAFLPFLLAFGTISYYLERTSDWQLSTSRAKPRLDCSRTAFAFVFTKLHQNGGRAHYATRL